MPTVLPSYWRFDAFSEYKINGNVSAKVQVQNIFNQYYFTSLYEQFASPGTISGAPGLPRTWMVTLRRDF